jgi:GDP-L-fucose synthase
VNSSASLSVAANTNSLAPTSEQLARLKQRRVYVAGHGGLVGSALLRALAPLDAQLLTRRSAELDLRNQRATAEFFRHERPEMVLFAAAKVGGIQANSRYPAEFLYDNLAMASNAIQSASEAGTARFVFLGSTCIYPRLAPQPMPESALLTGELEPTNEGYALAKIIGLKLCQFYRREHGVLFHSLIPTNLYGPGDNYHPDHSHVLPALVRRIHEAQVAGLDSVALWGTGSALREFLHVDDLAAAVLHLATIDNPPDWVNVGSGDEVTILQLATLIAEVVGFDGKLVTDPSRPDGTPRKLADSSLVTSTGWRPRISLRDGLVQTYQDFLSHTAAG